MERRTVYILLTRSGTCLSRLIHLATGDAYTHASIGLEEPRGPFYSFGRKDPRFLLPAGLIQEEIGRSWKCGHGQVPCCLYELSVSEETYQALRRRLDAMYARREVYHFNILGIFACRLHFPIQRQRRYFCSQFVATLLQDCGALELPKPPALLRPIDFCSIDGLRAIHQGDLKSLSSRPAA